MPITLSEVVPWGRTLDEYQRMFALSDADLSLSVLGCGDGPASFNAEWTAKGGYALSCDPLYEFSGDDIERRVRETFDFMMQAVRENYNDFIWQDITSPEALGERRLGAMQRFLDDYEKGKQEGRYITAALPSLPFAEGQFNLALVSHLLFLYSDQLDYAFHRDALLELCRVAREVRIFPLLALGNRPSLHLLPLIEEFTTRGFQIEQTKVDYEFQKGGNQMLRVKRPA
jgi:SAM-dependent methyltransferase